jgi:hypothetical protein
VEWLNGFTPKATPGCVRVDPGTQLAERGVGVGHDPVIVAQLREDRPDTGGDGGFADPGRRGGGHEP